MIGVDSWPQLVDGCGQLVAVNYAEQATACIAWEQVGPLVLLILTIYPVLSLHLHAGSKEMGTAVERMS